MKRIVLLAVLVISLLAVNVTASSFKFESSTDKLEINENFANVFSSLTKSQVPELQDGTITTKGSTKFNQYIRFSGIAPPVVTFEKNEANVVSDFLFIARNTGVNNAFFEYELEFEQGIQSDISQNVLIDIEGKQIYIFNEPYTITAATTSGNQVELQMVSGAASALIEQEETKQVTINGKAYAIKIVSIEDSTKKVKLNVDGADIPDLSKGEIYQLPDKTFIGIAKVLTSSGGTTQDLVEIFLGAKVIEFKDSNYQDANFEEKVEINNVKISGAYVSITGTMINSALKISKMKYRLTSFDDIRAKKGEKISQYLTNQKEGLLGNMDMRYEGLTSTTTNSITFTPASSDTEYKMTFKNKEGNTFSNIPFISNNGALKMGSVSNDLVFQENVLIDQNDYFIMTDRNDKTGTTYVLKYNSIDTTTQTVKVYDYATSTEKSITYTNSTIAGLIGTAELTIGAMKANMTINGTSGNPLHVDLDADGNFESNVVYIVTADGGILVTQALSGSTHTLNLRTEASQFEENSTDENIQFVFETRAGNAVGIQSTFSGITTETKEGNTIGLSNYGVSMTYADPGGTKAETLTFLYPQSQKFGQVYIDVLATAAIQTPASNTTVISLCTNNLQDAGETGVDCGGSCPPCQTETPLPSCSDSLQNQGETGTDCGGPCQPCIPLKQEGPCPTGCVYIGSDGLETCMDLGENTGTIYCGKNLEIKLKKSNGLVCEEAYECKIGICEKGECGKNITLPALLLNIIALLSFFGSLIYMIKTLLTKV